jgi:hypothetical protein
MRCLLVLTVPDEVGAIPSFFYFHLVIGFLPFSFLASLYLQPSSTSAWTLYVLISSGCTVHNTLDSSREIVCFA